MLISCEKAAQLESESRDRQLTFMQRVSLGFHMGMCKMCRIYRAQLHMLSRLSRRAGELVMDRPDASLAPDAKERIKQRLSRDD